MLCMTCILDRCRCRCRCLSQDGKFDRSDRLFHSVEACFASCTSTSSDVKELTPEFFYLPDFLRNLNGLDLGKRYDGEPVCDVVLPPWAWCVQHAKPLCSIAQLLYRVRCGDQALPSCHTPWTIS